MYDTTIEEKSPDPSAEKNARSWSFDERAEEAIRFMRVLFKDGETINMKYIKKKEIIDTVLRVQSKENLKILLKAIFEKHSDKNLYIGVKPRSVLDKNIVTKIRCFFVDIDSKDHGEKYHEHIDTTIKKLEEINLLPTMRIETGHGEHWYWILSEDIEVPQSQQEDNVNVWKKIQVSLVTFCKADKRVKDLSRVLRLPGSDNVKRDPVVLCKIKIINSNKYSLKDFEEIVQYMPPEKTPLKKTSSVKNSPINSGFQSNYYQETPYDDFTKIILEVLERTPNVCDDYDDFCLLGMALKSMGLPYHQVDKIFKNSRNYNHENNLNLYNSFDPKSITRGTAYYYAEKYNYDLLKQLLQERKIQKLPLFGIEARDSENIKDVLAVLDSKVLFLQAPTGVGKSYGVCERAIQNYYEEKKITIFCATRKDAKDIHVKLCRMAPGLKSKISMNISSNGVLQADKIFLSSSVKDIAITTYAYLGLRGMTTSMYKIAAKLCQGRILYCDEVQEFYKLCLVAIKLAQRYYMENFTYEATDECYKKSGKGECRDCTLAYKRKGLNQNKERLFYEAIACEAFSIHQDIISSADPAIEWKKIHDLDSYKHMIHTLYYQPLDNDVHYEILSDMFPVQDSFEDYLKVVQMYLLNAHLRIEYPIDDAGKPLKHSELIINSDLKTIKYPSYSCDTPYLMGVFILPILQLLESEKIVFMTATMPPDFVSIVKKICKENNFTVKEKSIANVPFTFNISILKMHKKLSTYKLNKLIRHLRGHKPKEKIFAVTSIQKNAKQLYGSLKNNIKGVRLFDGQDFICPPGEENFYTTITYGKSAMSRGSDLPDTNIVILNCNQFLPKIAIPIDFKAPDVEREILAKALEYIEWDIHQVIGRTLRSKKKRDIKRSVVDPRQIVILLHGIPAELDSIRVNHLVINAYQEYTNTFINETRGEDLASIGQSICMLLDGKTPYNWEKAILKKVSINGLSNLTKKERAVIQDKKAINKAQLDKKIRRLKVKVEKMIRNNPRVKWGKIYKDLHLERLKKANKNSLEKYTFKTFKIKALS